MEEKACPHCGKKPSDPKTKAPAPSPTVTEQVARGVQEGLRRDRIRREANRAIDESWGF